DPEKYISDLVDYRFEEPDAVTSAPTKPLMSALLRRRLYSYMAPVFLLAALAFIAVGFGYGYIAYKVMHYTEEGDALRRLQDPVGAIVAYRKALEADDRVAVPSMSLAEALQEAGRPQEAIPAYERALALDPA